jgi:hypothetical protein
MRMRMDDGVFEKRSSGGKKSAKKKLCVRTAGDDPIMSAPHVIMTDPDPSPKVERTTTGSEGHLSSSGKITVIAYERQMV